MQKFGTSYAKAAIVNRAKLFTLIALAATALAVSRVFAQSTANRKSHRDAQKDELGIDFVKGDFVRTKEELLKEFKTANAERRAEIIAAIQKERDRLRGEKDLMRQKVREELQANREQGLDSIRKAGAPSSPSRPGKPR